MKILITAFEPFGGNARNASLAAMNALPAFLDRGEGKERVQIAKVTLPVVFGRCGDALARAIAETEPAAVLSLGMAAGRGGITPEVFAVNCRYAKAPDNDGQSYPVLTPCNPAGPDGRRTTLPVEAIAARLTAEGIPAWLSFSAGTYVCNDLFYALMGMTEVPAGFIHVPQAKEDAPEGRDALPQAEIDRGVLLAVSVLAESL